MDLQIRWKAAQRSRAVEEHLRRRLDFALGRFRGLVNSVRAKLEDVNGPRGGLDKRCALELDGALGRRRVELTDVDFYSAIDRTARAASRALARAAQARVRDPRGLDRAELPAGASRPATSNETGS